MVPKEIFVTGFVISIQGHQNSLRDTLEVRKWCSANLDDEKDGSENLHPFFSQLSIAVFESITITYHCYHYVLQVIH